MASYTPNINLKKPTTSEMYNVLDWNDNSDKIDTAIGNLSSQIAQTIISSSTDLDTIINAAGSPGKTYSITSMSVVTNAPSGLNQNFPALLKSNSMSGYAIQELFVYTSTGDVDIWVRQQYYNNGNKTWGVWKNIVHTS